MENDVSGIVHFFALLIIAIGNRLHEERNRRRSVSAYVKRMKKQGHIHISFDCDGYRVEFTKGGFTKHGKQIELPDFLKKARNPHE
jgi:hypothetical protein